MTDSLRSTMASYTDRMRQLTPGKSGGFSLSRGGRLAITPTGVRYEELSPRDFPVIDSGSEVIKGSLDPSSELPMYRTLYDGLDCGAIVHTHSPWATTLAALGESLSYVHYAAALAGPEVPLVEYHTYGTEALARAVLEELRRTEASACLLANHGLLATGETLEDAFDVAEAVEFTARIECQARMIGTPNELSDDQVADAVNELKYYGQEDEVSAND